MENLGTSTQIVDEVGAFSFDTSKYIRGVSKTFGEWYQKTNKTEDTN
jgi:hypothetical protein